MDIIIVLCTFTGKDGENSSDETEISGTYGLSSTKEECAYKVYTYYRGTTLNGKSLAGATFTYSGNDIGKCYAEYGTVTEGNAGTYTFCYLP